MSDATAPPIRGGVYTYLNIYGDPDPTFGPYLFDVLPPKPGSNVWSVRAYMRQGPCWTWSAFSTQDGQATIKCNAKQCMFEYVNPSYYGRRRQVLWHPRSASEMSVSYVKVAGSTMDSEEERFSWSRELDNTDILCDGCPADPVSPDLPYYGPPICDASCQGEDPPFGFESPLVFAFDNAPVQFTGKPVGFDFYGDGSKPLLDWLKAPAGLLALDLNGNGTIDDGGELFGTSTKIAATGQYADNGFAALAQYDQNGNGRIEAVDAVYAKLQVWVDADEDGVSQPSELTSLAAAGVTSISLKRQEVAHDPNTHASYVDSQASFEYQVHLCHSVWRVVSDVWFAMNPRQTH